MNALFERIQKDYNAARVLARRVDENEATRLYAGIKVSLLSTLLGDVNPGGGVEPTDERVVNTLVSYAKKNTEAMDHVSAAMSKPLPEIAPFPTEQMVKELKVCNAYAKLAIERNIIEEYLPPALCESQILAVVEKLGTTNKGQIMGACKKESTALGLRFDGALVNRALAKYQDMTVIVKNESFDMIEKLIENPPELNDTMKAAIERSKNGVFEINVDRRN